MENESNKLEEVSFQLTYSAIKMFGKQLYSNASSAISELVANGIDAKARVVKILIDVFDKSNSKIEIFDSGIGMTSEDIREKYIKIGHNKRKDFASQNDKTMGRKGIGKLAALYLSNKFCIFTKSKITHELSAWELDVSKTEDEDTPQLVKQNKIYQGIFKKEFDKCKGGTIISLENVDLTGFAERTFEALKVKLSNLFLYDKLSTDVKICIREQENDEYIFKPIEKQIAFKNMCCVYTDTPQGFSFLKDNSYNMKFKTKTGEERKFTQKVEIKNFSDLKGINFSGDAIFEGKRKHYQLKGWVGIHTTIDTDEAFQNDKRFIKNKIYSPNQLRVYVRNKLAVANVLEHLGNTRAFANYIEGEVSFDILDDDELTDIATAGRQDFDTSDDRFQLLISLLTPIANSLVRNRQEVADKVKRLKDKVDRQINSKAKEIFGRDVKKELDKIQGLTKEIKQQALNISLEKLSGGNAEPKCNYTLFISHARKDSIFSDFIYHYLVSKGFCGDDSKEDCEIFYSSSGLDNDNLDPLSLRIRDFIIAKDNDILFITSKNFKNSEYCLFEGGAAWATKSIEDYKIWNLDNYDNIPKFLTNGKSEYVFEAINIESYDLKPYDYKNIVNIINNIIAHLNKNKEVKGEKPVGLISLPQFPDEVQLKKTGKCYRDYYDADLMDYWDTYVKCNADDYIRENKKLAGVVKTGIFSYLKLWNKG